MLTEKRKLLNSSYFPQPAQSKADAFKLAAGEILSKYISFIVFIVKLSTRAREGKPVNWLLVKVMRLWFKTDED